MFSSCFPKSLSGKPLVTPSNNSPSSAAAPVDGQNDPVQGSYPLFAAASQTKECQTFFTRLADPQPPTTDTSAVPTEPEKLLPSDIQKFFQTTQVKLSQLEKEEGPGTLLEKLVTHLDKESSLQPLRTAIEKTLQDGDLPEMRELATKMAFSRADCAHLALLLTVLLCYIAFVVFGCLTSAGVGGAFAPLASILGNAWSPPAIASLCAMFLLFIPIALLMRFAMFHIKEPKIYTYTTDVHIFINVFLSEEGTQDPQNKDGVAEALKELSFRLHALLNLEEAGLTLKKGPVLFPQRTAFKQFVSKKENLRILTELAKVYVNSEKVPQTLSN